jgi:hypothetical protein
MGAAHGPLQPPLDRQAAHDRRLALVGAAVYFSTALKVSPHVGLSGNIQSAVGLTSCAMNASC